MLSGPTNQSPLAIFPPEIIRRHYQFLTGDTGNYNVLNLCWPAGCFGSLWPRFQGLWPSFRALGSSTGEDRQTDKQT